MQICVATKIASQRFTPTDGGLGHVIMGPARNYQEDCQIFLTLGAEISFLFNVLIDFYAESFMHSACLRTSTATGRHFNYTYKRRKFVAEGEVCNAEMEHK